MHPKGIPQPITLHSVRGVGGDEGLMLSEVMERMIELQSPIPARFTVIEGKDAGGALRDAEVIGLSAREALVRGAAPEPLSNVKMHVKLSDVPMESSTIYGKVTEALGDGWFRIHFTSVSAEVAQRINQILRG